MEKWRISKKKHWEKEADFEERETTEGRKKGDFFKQADMLKSYESSSKTRVRQSVEKNREKKKKERKKKNI